MKEVPKRDREERHDQGADHGKHGDDAPLPVVLEGAAAAPSEARGDRDPGAESQHEVERVVSERFTVTSEPDVLRDPHRGEGDGDDAAAEPDARGESAESDGEAVLLALAQSCTTRTSESSAASPMASDMVG